MISEKEINALINQDANIRFEYTVKRIADFELVWVIEKAEKFILLGDNFGNYIFPIWPFKEFAEIFCVGEYADCRVSSIPLDEFLEVDIPHFREQGFKMSLFPLSTGKGGVVDIEMFLGVLGEELDKY
ncbi:DUF2750 domain-containing protein [Chitinophaga sancti]|uniref:DUF2750 domain-containing protein n=1 Tax=Chitinophaga sancti TaxID=1004 RepID=A0A1K1SCI4_9BACT|nr:DUF2750 domain-containing protein [Chitinophaga sancti]WQD63574.1 DUF2750 domain-containing protein [Chitinophaga sancti]WQG90800.1 DUF2750 domain-containing protein [Chitinophaga sancti]SFW81812.1 Protein of unknown function [Chitinophaga sancti]